MKRLFNLCRTAVFIIGFSVSLLFSCKFEDPWPEENGVAVGSYISSNPTDPEFTKIVTNEGEVVNIFGSRKPNGLPSVIEQLNIQTISGANSFFFNENGTLSSIICDNGTVFNYEIQGDGVVALNIICNDGQTELNLNFDSNSISLAEDSTASEIFSCNELGFEKLESIENTALKSKQQNSYLLHVTNCYATNLYDRPSRILLYDNTGKELLKELSAAYYDAGIYEIEIPDSDVEPVNQDALVENLTQVMQNICNDTVLTKITSGEACSLINEQISDLGITANVANGIGTACSGIQDAMHLYNKLISSEQPDGATAIDAMLNQKMVENFTYNESSLMLKVIFNTVPAKEFEFTLADNLSKDLYAELNSNSTAVIKKIEVDPLLPNNTDDYTVYFLVYCVPIGSTITVTITGDDGFYDEASLQISSEDQSTGWYNYIVKGRNGKIKDIITVKISNGWSAEVVRTLTMSFGSYGTNLTGAYETYSFNLQPGLGLLGIANDGVNIYDETTNNNILTWNGNRFSMSYDYSEGSNTMKYSINGSIQYTSATTALLTFDYTCSQDVNDQGLSWDINQSLSVRSLPAKSISEAEAIFVVNGDTPNLQKAISNYISYSNYWKMGDEVYDTQNQFNSDAEFEFIFKR